MQRSPSLLALTLLAACHGGPAFDVTAKADSTVPGSPLGALISDLPLGASFTNFDLSQTQDFKNQGVTKTEVSSVKVTSLELQITSPNSQDFSFLDSLDFYATAQGLPQVRVAHKEGISSLGLKAPNPTLVMDLDGAELQPYVTAASMSLTTSANGHQPGQDTDIEATVVFHVTANLP
jgi:hypothetical protein